jgi:hypothetical protein
MRAILVIAAALVACGAQKPCTLVGCQSGTIFTLLPLSGTLMPGSYTVSLANIGNASCTINQDGTINTAACNSGDPSLAESNSTLKFFFTTGTVASPAAMITVTVTNGDTSLYNMTIPQTAHEVFPNGSSCPGTCSQADVTVMVQ